jgi:hypothetical protein
MTSKLPPNQLLPKTAAPGRPAHLPPPRYIPQAPAVQSKPLQSAPPAYTPFKNSSGAPNPSGPMVQQKVNPGKPPLQMKGGLVSTTGLPPQVFRPAGASSPAVPSRVPLQGSVVPGAQYVQQMPLASNSIQTRCDQGHPSHPSGPCISAPLNVKGLQPGQKRPKQTSHHQHPRPKKGAAKRRRGRR